MDTLTHIVLGATLGEALAGPELRKRAMLFGAIAQSIPDIDVVAALWLDPASDLMAHRGFTHSILFVALLSPLLALAGDRWNRNSGLSRQGWLIFFGVQMMTHIFLDSFNAYGTGWFEPFSHQRISFNVLFVVDPLYTIWLVVSAVVLLALANSKPSRARWAWFGLVMSSLYLFCAVATKTIINTEARKSLVTQSIQYHSYFTTPTPFNSLLFFVVAADAKGYHVGYRSIFDRSPRTEFQYFPKNDSLLDLVRARADVDALIRFSQDRYTISRVEDALLFNDLRFGQMEGWKNPKAGFVFHYYLLKPEENTLVIQRGRISGLSRTFAGSLWDRIRGN